MDANSTAIAQFSSARIYSDLQGLAGLKLAAKQESPEAIREVAEQFEAMFLKMMLKSMRDATQQSELFNSQKQEFYQDMHDQQLSLELAGKGTVGLADVLIRQLGGKVPENTPGHDLKDIDIEQVTKSFNDVKYPFTYEHDKTLSLDSGINKTESINTETPVAEEKVFTDIQDFIETLTPFAQQAAEEIGVDYKVLLAQSALETGWGKKIIKNSDGASSHNLFGIKAHNNWQGNSAKVHSLEYQNDTFKPVLSDFRSYQTFADSFSDYVSFLKNNPRYEKALSLTDKADLFVEELQQAGYATDPEYASKILSILEHTIKPVEQSSSVQASTHVSG